MTKERKQLIIGVLAESNIDKGCSDELLEVMKYVFKISKELNIDKGHPKYKLFMDLETRIDELFHKTKNAYFDFGADAERIETEYEL